MSYFGSIPFESNPSLIRIMIGLSLKSVGSVRTDPFISHRDVLSIYFYLETMGKKESIFISGVLM